MLYFTLPTCEPLKKVNSILFTYYFSPLVSEDCIPDIFLSSVIVEIPFLHWGMFRGKSLLCIMYKPLLWQPEPRVKVMELLWNSLCDYNENPCEPICGTSIQISMSATSSS